MKLTSKEFEQKLYMENNPMYSSYIKFLDNCNQEDDDMDLKTSYWNDFIVTGTVPETETKQEGIAMLPEYDEDYKYLHLRYYNSDGTPSNLGGATIAYTYETSYQNCGVYVYGISICSKKDNFNKAIGRTLAVFRLNRNPSVAIFPNNIKNIRVIDFYYSIFIGETPILKKMAEIIDNNHF